MNDLSAVVPQTVARLTLAQPDATLTASPPAPPTGGADMMGGTGVPGTPGTVAPGTPGGPGGATRAPGLFDGPMGMITLFMVGMLVFMLFTSSRRQKREAAKRQELLNSLRKGDTVLTIAGIKGTIAESPADKDEVYIIVDEQNRTRIRFAKSAITQVVREGSGATASVEAKATEAQPAGV